MTDLDRAIAAAHEALAAYRRNSTRHYIDEALEDVLAALDAAQPVAYLWPGSIQALKAGQRPVEALLWTTPTGQAGVPIYLTPQAQPAEQSECKATPCAVPAGYDEDEIADACIMAEVSDSKYEAIITYLGDNRRRAAANKENKP